MSNVFNRFGALVVLLTAFCGSNHAFAEQGEVNYINDLLSLNPNTFPLSQSGFPNVVIRVRQNPNAGQYTLTNTWSGTNTSTRLASYTSGWSWDLFGGQVMISTDNGMSIITNTGFNSGGPITLTGPLKAQAGFSVSFLGVRAPNGFQLTTASGPSGNALLRWETNGVVYPYYLEQYYAALTNVNLDVQYQINNLDGRKPQFYAIGDGVCNNSAGTQAYTSYAVSTGQSSHTIWNNGVGILIEWSTVYQNWGSPGYGDTNYNGVPFEMGAGIALVTTNTPDGSTKTNYAKVLRNQQDVWQVRPGVRTVSDPIGLPFHYGDKLYVRSAISRVQSFTNITAGGTYGTLPYDQASLYVTLPNAFSSSGAYTSSGDAAIYYTYSNWTNGTGANTGGNPFTNVAWVPTTWTTVLSNTAAQIFRPSAIYGFLNANGNGYTSKSVNYVSTSVAPVHSWGLKGNSIFQGTADFYNTGTSDGGIGWGRRALVGHTAFIQYAASGEKLRYWTDNLSGAVIRQEYPHHVVTELCELGTNDAYSGDTVNNIELSILQNAVQDRAAGVTNFIQTTFLPHGVTVSGGLANLWTNVTQETTGSYQTNFTTINAWLRQGAPCLASTTVPGSFYPTSYTNTAALFVGNVGHPITAVFDAASYGETSTNSGLWQVSSTNYQTGLTISTYTGSSAGAPTLANGQTSVSTVASWVLISGTPGFGTTGNNGYGSLVGLALVDDTAGAWGIVIGNTATQIALDRTMSGAASSDACHLIPIPTSDGTHPSMWWDVNVLAPAFVNWFNGTGMAW